MFWAGYDFALGIITAIAVFFALWMLLKHWRVCFEFLRILKIPILLVFLSLLFGFSTFYYTNNLHVAFIACVISFGVLVGLTIGKDDIARNVKKSNKELDKTIKRLRYEKEDKSKK